MKRLYNIKALCVTVLLGTAATAGAQEDKTKEKNLNREMTLEREYDPTIQDASKVNTLPVIKEPVVKKRAIDYADFTVPADPEKEISLLPSGTVMTDILHNQRRGYFNFGGGTYLNLNGDAGYHILSTDKDKLNLWFSHRSTNGKVKYLQEVPEAYEKVKAKLNDNIGGLNFSHLFRRALLDAGFKFGYSTYNYYGLPVNGGISSLPAADYIDLADRETNQADQTIQGGIGLRSVAGASFGYDVRLDYTHFSHKYGEYKTDDGVKENAFGWGVDLFAPFHGDKQIGLAGEMKYYNYSHSVPTGIELYDAGTSEPGPYTSYDNHFNGLLNPYFKMAGDNWHLKLGANIMMVAGLETWDKAKLYASPDIAADVTVADKTVLYAKAGGKLRDNSMYDITQLNRYANPVLATTPSFNWLDAKLGVRSSAAASFRFDLFGGYQVTDYDFFFIAYNYFDRFAQGKFNYAEMRSDIDSKRFYAGADLRYSYQQVIDLRLKGVYNKWTMHLGDSYVGGEPNAEIDPIGKPEMELTAGITIRPIKPLSASLDYNLATGRKAEVFGVTQKLKNINELNLTGTYTFNDTFGLYLQLHNLLFQKQELYYGYPLQSFSAMVGVNINF